MAGFGDRMAGAVRRCGTPVVVGLDPRWGSLPEPLREGRVASSLADQSAAFVDFCTGIIDAVAPLAPAVKPQSAFFEQLGPAGVKALAEVVAHARAAGLLVIMDAKRNDIGSTAEAYADAYLGADSAFGADALTVSPYLGSDSLAPFIKTAQQRDSGVFVLVKTSNPGGGQFQDLICGERTLYARVAAYVEELAASDAGESGYGAAGAVVGATYPEQLAELRAAMPHAWLLVPGYGSQGGSAADVAGAFDALGLGAIVNNSRGIIFAHARPEYAGRFGARRWQDAAAAATQDMIQALASETRAGQLVGASR